jgi:hypothetical protein
MRDLDFFTNGLYWNPEALLLAQAELAQSKFAQ